MPLTQAVWDAFSEKAQWDIKVALRGPDSCYGETLKWFTTSVLRGFCSEVFRVGGTVNPDLKLVVLPAGSMSEEQSLAYQQAGALGWNFSHFTEHIRTAADWLELPVLRIEAVVWHEVMKGRHWSQSGQEILAAAKAWKEKKPEAETDQVINYKQLVVSPRNLYTPVLIKELERHLKNGRYY